ncbi:MAG: hypothetical protein ACOC8D_03125 [bacterium]
MRGKTAWRGLAMTVAAAVLMTACAREDAHGPSPAAARETRVRGTVTVTRDEEGAIDAVTVTSSSGKIYVVELDQQGERLAQKMNGRAAQLTGVVVEAEGQNRLTVSSFRPAEAPNPPPTTQDEASQQTP